MNPNIVLFLKDQILCRALLLCSSVTAAFSVVTAAEPSCWLVLELYSVRVCVRMCV